MWPIIGLISHVACMQISNFWNKIFFIECNRASVVSKKIFEEVGRSIIYVIIYSNSTSMAEKPPLIMMKHLLLFFVDCPAVK